MAQKKLYALFDRKVKAYMNPLVFVNDGEAIRWFTTVVNRGDKDNVVCLYPESFYLAYLGELDASNGQLISSVEELIEGSSVKSDVKKFTVEELIETFDKRYEVKD